MRATLWSTLSLLMLAVAFMSTQSLVLAGPLQSTGTITSVVPTFGPQGTTVSIRGAGLGIGGVRWAKSVSGEEAPGHVVFGGGAAGDVLFWGEDLISVKVPAGAITGPVRIVWPDGHSVVAVSDFEVYYSSSRESAEPVDRSFDLHSRDERNQSGAQPAAPEWTPPERSEFSFADPWFTGLAPGQRTFLGEHGWDAFWFGNPFTFNGTDRFFDDGFFHFGHDRGFDTFGFQRLFFFDALHRGLAHRRFIHPGFANRSQTPTSIGPFWFFRR